METKECSKCGIKKNLGEFGLHLGKPRSQCKECHRENNKKYYFAHKDEYRKRSKEWSKKNKESVRFYYVKRTYGISKEDWITMLEQQNNCCAICGTHSNDKTFFSTDHDHKTGKVRGLLCKNCNTILGHSKDNIEILQNAIKYLKTNNNEDTMSEV